MSIESQTQILEQNKQTPEEHVQEVKDLLTDSTKEINEQDTSQRADYQTTEMYQSTEDWESNLGLTLGAVPLHKENELSKPERFAYGANKLKQEQNVDVTKIGEIEVDGIGRHSSIAATYNVHLDYSEQLGIQYNIEREGTTADNLDRQKKAKSEVQQVDDLLETVTDEYNQQIQTPEEPTTEVNNQQQADTGWTYGQNRAEIVADD